MAFAEMMNPQHPKWRRVDAVGAMAMVVAGLVALALPWIDGAGARHERLVMIAFSTGVYLVVFVLASMLFALPQRARHQTTFVRAWRGVWGWIWRWHGLVVLSLTAGALAGTLLYTAGGPLFGFDGTIAEFALQGARDGAFYVLIWSPGGALVFCFMQAFGPSQQNPARASKGQR